VQLCVWVMRMKARSLGRSRSAAKNQVPRLSTMQIEEIRQLLNEASVGDFPHGAPCVCAECIAAVPMVYRNNKEAEWIGRATYFLGLLILWDVADAITAGPSNREGIN